MAKKRAPVKAGTGKDAAAARKKAFAEAFIANGGNASEAARTAGYSAKTAGQQGSRLLKDVQVAAWIADRSKKLAEKYELTTEMVMRSIVQELTFDPAKLYGKDGQLLPITELPEDIRMALSAVEFEQIGAGEALVRVSKVKWAQRHSAREQAMKHLGLFKEDNVQRHPVQDLPDDALDRLIAAKAKELGVTVH